MKPALRSFVLITAVALMSVFVIWGYLRAKGALAPLHRPLKNSFTQDTAHPGPDVVSYHALGDKGLSGSRLERFAQLAQLSDKLVFWLDIHIDEKGNLLVDEPPTTTGSSQAPQTDGLVCSTGDAGNHNATCGATPAETDEPLRLSDVLTQLRKHRLILSFFGHQPGLLEVIIRDLATNPAMDRALIQSPEDGMLKDLREAQPLWLYGSSQAQVTRLIMLASLGLEMSAPLKGDVFVMTSQDPEAHELERLSDSIIHEIHRREMKIYAGPAEASQINTFAQRGIDGVLTSQPKEYLDSATLAVAPGSRTN